mmetsp:Transcript_29318/g.50197  ORF Transcript_29318/g.50197 Transcript_29318/m.50197 type:complete len:325 (+) Transcript_29318:229-1203(+)
MAHSEGGGEDAEDEEGLSRRLVFDVVGDGVLQEGDLGEHLRQHEAKEDGGVGRLADRVQVGRHAELRDVDRRDADPLGLVDAKGDGQRVHAEGGVSLDRLEVVDDGDAEASDGVEDRQDDLLEADRSRVEHRVPAPPRQSNVRRAECVGALPAVGLQLERRRRVDVGHEGADGGDERDDGPVVARPVVQAEGDHYAADQQEPRLEDDLALRDCPGRDRPVGLVDRVELTVVPVVDGLREAAHERSRQHHRAQGLDGVAADLTNRVGGRRVPKEIPNGMVVARCRRAARDAPDQRHPCRRLSQLKPDLPVQRRLHVASGGALEAK